LVIPGNFGFQISDFGFRIKPVRENNPKSAIQNPK